MSLCVGKPLRVPSKYFCIKGLANSSSVKVDRALLANGSFLRLDIVLILDSGAIHGCKNTKGKTCPADSACLNALSAFGVKGTSKPSIVPNNSFAKGLPTNLSVNTDPAMKPPTPAIGLDKTPKGANGPGKGI